MIDWTKYTFNDTWFMQHEAAWDTELLPWLEHFMIRRPFIRTLEVGSYEGLSAVWIITACKKVAPQALHRHVFVDAWPGPEYKPIRDRCIENIRRAQGAHVTICEERSIMALAQYDNEVFDFIYIDGSHKEDDVFFDTRQAIRLVSRGGMVLWDDYACTTTPGEERDAVRAGVKRALETCNINADTLPLLGQHLRYDKK